MEEAKHGQHDGGGDVVTRRHHRTSNQASEHHQATEDMHARGTVQPFTGKSPSEFEHMVGGQVKKVYWFMGVIKTIRVEEEEGGISNFIYVKFDDSDEEDYIFNDLCKLRRDDGCDLVIGNLGYKFWKGFPHVGKETEVHYAKHNQGKTVPCSC